MTQQEIETLRQFLRSLHRHTKGIAAACEVMMATLPASPQEKQKIVYNSLSNGDGVVTTPAPEFEE